MSRSLALSTIAWAVLGAVAPAPPSQADEADDQYAVAAGHYTRQRWALAAEQFHAFAERFSTHAKANQARFFGAEALVQLGRHHEAAEGFRDYLRREPDGAWARPARFRAAEADYLAGKYDSARGDLERFLADFPDDDLNGFVLPYLGSILLSNEQYEAAEKHFRDALRRFPQGKMQDDCRFGLARALDRQGQTEEAQRLYLAVAAKKGGSLADDAQFHLGALHYAAERFDEALVAFEPFESTMSDSPRRPMAQLGRGWALFRLGRREEAARAFESVAADAQVAVEARYWLGLTRKADKDWDAAAQTFLESVREHSDHPLAAALRFHAGDCLLRAGDLPAAAAEFDAVIRGAPPGNEWIDDAFRGRVLAALRADDHAAVERLAAEFDGRVAESPLRDDVQRLLARSRLGRKQYRRAIEVLEPLVEGRAETPTADDRFLLAMAYAGLDATQEALDALQPALGSATGELRADVRRLEASLLMKLARYAEAGAVLEQLRQDDATNLADLAVCYAKTGQLEKAQRAYEQLVHKAPDRELLSSTTEQLAEAAYEAGDAGRASQWFGALADDAQAGQHQIQGLSGLAWSQYRAGDLERAAATFGRLLEKGPPPALAAEAALARGQILEDLGQMDPALSMYDAVIERYTDSEPYSQALWAAARLRDALEQDREAAALYERLAGEFPQFAAIDAVLYGWAWSLRDLGQEEESWALFERLCHDHPSSSYRADASLELARRAFDEGDRPRARQLVGEVLAGRPRDDLRGNALYLSGQIAAADERWDEASQAFEQLLDEGPDESLRLLAEYGLAEAAFRRNDHQAARERFDRLRRACQGRPERWLAVIPLRLVQTLCHEKKWSEAYEIAATIEAAYPGFPEQYEVDYAIGRCLSARADFEAAREAYRKVIRSSEGAKTETAAKAQLMIAESYYHQENYEAALREYLALEILYDFPALQAAALLQAGKCHEMLGEWKEAAEQYTLLLKGYPESDLVEDATQRLAAARSRLP